MLPTHTKKPILMDLFVGSGVFATFQAFTPGRIGYILRPVSSVCLRNLDADMDHTHPKVARQTAK